MNSITSSNQTATIAYDDDGFRVGMNVTPEMRKAVRNVRTQNVATDEDGFSADAHVEPADRRAVREAAFRF